MSYSFQQFIRNEESCATLCLVITSIGLAISSAEWLTRRSLLGTTGVLSGEVVSVARAQSATTTVELGVLRLAGSTRFFFLRAVASGLVAVLGTLSLAGMSSNGHLRAAIVVALLVLALLKLVEKLRVPVGLDGSDDMASIVVIAFAMAHVIATTRALQFALMFTAAQSALSYLTAGSVKLAGPKWRDGSALPEILSCESYGIRSIRIPRVLRPALSWTIVGFELGWPAVFILPQPLAIAVIALGGSFHLACGLLMGLNGFFWSFTATYPAVLYAHALWHSP